MATPLDVDELAARLPAPRVVGRALQVFAETGSTNDVIARAGGLGAREGLVAFAETQRAGRGRQGRRWASAPGLGLWFSVLLRPPAETVPLWPQLALLAALATATAAENAAGVPTRIKWPNDVLLAERKVGGILIETHASGGAPCVVVGIGLNVFHQPGDFPPELRGRAGSVAMAAAAAGHPVDRLGLAADLLGRLDALYAGWPGNRTEIAAACGQRSPWHGRRVRVLDGSDGVSGGATGTVEGFDESGRLLLRVDGDGIPRAISSGEVVGEPGGSC